MQPTLFIYQQTIGHLPAINHVLDAVFGKPQDVEFFSLVALLKINVWGRLLFGVYRGGSCRGSRGSPDFCLTNDNLPRPAQRREQ